MSRRITMGVEPQVDRQGAWDAAGELLSLVAATPTPVRDPVAGLDALAFRIPALIFEGLETSDKRMVEAGALKPRALPWGLAAMRVNPEFGGHGLAFVAGHVDKLTRVSAAGWVNPLGGTYPANTFAWQAEGFFNDDEDGHWVADRVADGSLRYVSADLAGVTSEIDVTEVDADGFPIDFLERVTEGELVGATVCNGSAFAGCFIELVNAPADTPAEVPPAVAASVPAIEHTDWLNAIILNDGPGCEPCAAGVTAAPSLTAAGGPMRPPGTWFADPHLTEPTALQITDDGRIFGHGALWGVCHLGFADKCVTAPQSTTNYSMFRLGAVRTAEGDDVAVGPLTFGTGHADLRLDYAAAMAHYDNTGNRWADVVVGEDEFGIWIAGAVLPHITDEQLRVVKGVGVSGDWRRMGTGMELINFLSVNTPAFPVPRALAASGVPMALVAAGALPAQQAAPELTGMERVTLNLARDMALSRLPKRRSLKTRRDEALARLKR